MSVFLDGQNESERFRFLKKRERSAFQSLGDPASDRDPAAWGCFHGHRSLPPSGWQKRGFILRQSYTESVKTPFEHQMLCHKSAHCLLAELIMSFPHCYYLSPKMYIKRHCQLTFGSKWDLHEDWQGFLQIVLRSPSVYLYILNSLLSRRWTVQLKGGNPLGPTKTQEFCILLLVMWYLLINEQFLCSTAHIRSER